MTPLQQHADPNKSRVPVVPCEGHGCIPGTYIHTHTVSQPELNRLKLGVQQLDPGADVGRHQARLTLAVVPAELAPPLGCSLVWYKPESMV